MNGRDLLEDVLKLYRLEIGGSRINIPVPEMGLCGFTPYIHIFLSLKIPAEITRKSIFKTTILTDNLEFLVTQEPPSPADNLRNGTLHQTVRLAVLPDPIVHLIRPFRVLRPITSNNNSVPSDAKLFQVGSAPSQ